MGRAPAYQPQGSKFKLQYYQNKLKYKNIETKEGTVTS